MCLKCQHTSTKATYYHKCVLNGIGKSLNYFFYITVRLMCFSYTEMLLIITLLWMFVLGTSLYIK